MGVNSRNSVLAGPRHIATTGQNGNPTVRKGKPLAAGLEEAWKVFARNAPSATAPRSEVVATASIDLHPRAKLSLTLRGHDASDFRVEYRDRDGTVKTVRPQPNGLISVELLGKNRDRSKSAKPDDFTRLRVDGRMTPRGTFEVTYSEIVLNKSLDRYAPELWTGRLEAPRDIALAYAM